MRGRIIFIPVGDFSIPVIATNHNGVAMYDIYSFFDASRVVASLAIPTQGLVAAISRIYGLSVNDFWQLYYSLLSALHTQELSWAELGPKGLAIEYKHKHRHVELISSCMAQPEWELLTKAGTYTLVNMNEV